MTAAEGAKVAEYRGEVLTHDRPRHMAVKMTGGSFGDSAMLVDYRLADLGGWTHLDYEARMELRGLMRLFAPSSPFSAALQILAFFRTLKALAEGASAPTA